MEVTLHANYQPHDKQRAFHESTARFKCAVAGRRGGKTRSGAEDFLHRIYTQDLPKALAKPYRPGSARKGTSEWWRRVPRLHYWIVAEVFDLIDEAKRQLYLAMPDGLLEHTNSADSAMWLKPDILVECKTGKDPKRLVGAGLNGVWLEEASRLAPTAWQEFIRPTLSDKLGWCNVTGTPLGRDWVYENFVKPAQKEVPGYEFHTWRTIDNPHVQREEIEHQRKVMAPEFFRREYEASFDAFIGQIYSEWNDKWCFDEVPQGLQFARILGGCDWGYTNPGALVVVGIGYDGTVWVLDEVYKRQLLVEEFWVPEAKKLQEKWRFNEWVADPAEPDNIQRFSRAGMQVTGHRNYGSGKFDEHARSVMSGIRRVSGLIHQGKLRISKNCKNTLDELRNYRWDDLPKSHITDPNFTFQERPRPHQSDHAITSMRYVISYALKGSSMRAL